MVNKMEIFDENKYHEAAKICSCVYKELLQRILQETQTNVKQLCEYGNSRIQEECGKIYKKETNKGTAFPVSISLNDCLGNYVYEPNNEAYNIIKPGDTIKIDLGVNICGCIAILGETVTINEPSEHQQKRIKLLNSLAKTICKNMKAGTTNDEIRIMLESKCTENGCFPIENCVSYQQIDGQLHTQESKYMILNYQKYYGDDDKLLVEQNICFEFLPNEVYNINLVITDERENDEKAPYKETHLPHIYRFNEFFYSLKLKSSREFCRKTKNKIGTNAFVLNDFAQTIKDKLGVKECIGSGILTSYPVLYNRDKSHVFHKKFTVIVKEDKCAPLKYL